MNVSASTPKQQQQHIDIHALLREYRTKILDFASKNFVLVIAATVLIAVTNLMKAKKSL